MSTVTGTVNLAPLERRLDRVIEATSQIQDQVASNSRQIFSLSSELNGLKAMFERFVDETKRANSLQKAATELIRVRQELEQNFGNYKIVRETMLGILQATDLALVKKTTISQVSEELMLSTPDYWLAPCLIAVAAWIGNDRDLANRAVKEAVRRDEEKTALTMALICRRNNRTDTCFEWLSIYFAHQRAQHFTESNFTYLNAYLNGVFGTDKNHMCEDYVAKWLAEIQGSGDDFENQQSEIWSEYCRNFTVDLEGQFPQMKSTVREYADIYNYVSRINSVDTISQKFTGIKNVDSQQEKLKADIDQTLVALISRCDTKEEPLRKEEKYLHAVRYFDGDTEAAKQSVMEADRLRKEETIDLVAQMTNIIINREDARPSERKTSVNFLSTYIRNGFRKYMTELRPNFPKQITLNINGWTGTTADGGNAAALQNDYEQYMLNEWRLKLNAISSSKQTGMLITAAIFAVLSIILLLVAGPVAIATIAVAIICLVSGINAKKTNQAMIQSTNMKYRRKIDEGKLQIYEALGEWREARNIVSIHESKELPDIVA